MFVLPYIANNSVCSADFFFFCGNIIAAKLNGFRCNPSLIRGRTWVGMSEYKLHFLVHPKINHVYFG
jgi:hypothetical protein